MAKGAVGAMGVVVPDVLGNNGLEVTTAEDEEPVEAFTTQGADL